MTTLQLTEIDADGPEDDPPPFDNPSDAGPYIHLYPDSTEEAPYGYKPNGEPYKRHHSGKSDGGKGKVATSSKANEGLATSAAFMLAQINTLVGMSLMVFGLPETGASINKANDDFMVMAKEALRTDPALCKKIMSAGASSGRTMLLMAYINLGASAFPTARTEFIERRQAKEQAHDNDYAAG